jgi:succinoglycan biosynthesis protein ExoW
MITIAVIIPYFQRRDGILRRALTSLLRQKLPENVARVDVIVVDDGSAVPARGEIAALDIAGPFQLRLIDQANAGVAAARNRALAAVAPYTTYIAFLDSDDIWDPAHLATAVDALERGYDFYFCDGRRINSAASTFSDSAAAPPFKDFLSNSATRMIGDRLYQMETAAFFSQSLLRAGYGIPAVVYRRAIAPALVFDTSLREVGEDSLFLLQLVRKCRKICCSSRELVLFADGVNIFASKYSWEDPGHLLKYMGTILYYEKLLETCQLSRKDAGFVSGLVRRYHRTFAFLSVRYFVKKRELWPLKLVELTRCDPAFWLWYPAWAGYVLLGYALGFYDPFKRGDIHPAPEETAVAMGASGLR